MPNARRVLYRRRRVTIRPRTRRVLRMPITMRRIVRRRSSVRRRR